MPCADAPDDTNAARTENAAIVIAIRDRIIIVAISNKNERTALCRRRKRRAWALPGKYCVAIEISVQLIAELDVDGGLA